MWLLGNFAIFAPLLWRQSFPAMGPPECTEHSENGSFEAKEFLGISLFPTLWSVRGYQENTGAQLGEGLASKMPWDCLGDPSITWL